MSSDLAQAKAELRAVMRARRRALRPAERAERSAAAARHLLGWLAKDPALDPIALFRSLPGEIDTAPLIKALAGRRRLLLPRQVARGRPLRFHAWAPGQPLASGPFGVEEPVLEAPLLRPRLVLVPLLAFDSHGGRLGYGAGFYDRTLASLARQGVAPLAVGYAFDLQEVEAVPTDAHDAPLALIVTESGILAPAGQGMDRTQPKE